MALTGYLLSETDKQEIRNLVKLAKSLRSNPQNLPAPAPEPTDLWSSAAEAYVALTPTGGIPGRKEEYVATGTGWIPETGTGTAPDVGDIPGAADCQVWEMWQGEMRPAPMGEVSVNNFAESAIPGDIWILIVRDKYGTWWPGGAGIGAGGGGGLPTTGLMSFAKCLVSSPTSGLYDARLQVNMSSGTLSDSGASIWLREANLQTQLVQNEIYACTKTGFASGRDVYTLEDFDLDVEDLRSDTGTGIPPVYTHVRTLVFDSTPTAYDPVHGDFKFTYNAATRTLTIRLNGYTGTKGVCQDDGTYHVWHYNNGLLKT